MRFVLFLLFFNFILIRLCSADILPTNFVGAWLFDEGNGNKAIDISGKTGTATLWNEVKWIPGKNGNAVEFDGKNDYIEIALPEIFNAIPKNDFTVTFWVNVEDISGSGTIWTRIMEIRNDNSNYLQFVIQINDGELGINIMSDGNESTFIVNSPISANKWYYVTGVWKASQKAIQLYLDGILQTGVGTMPASPGDKKAINIGRRTDGNEETYFTGIIDDFAIINKAITEDDIKNLMKNGLKAYANVSSLGKLTTAWGVLKNN